MIIEKESDLRVLRNFYDYPFDYFSVAEISQKTGISRNWIYKIIGKLEKNQILSASGKKYKLDFSNLFCKRLKLLFDSEDLNSLDKKTKEKVFSIANKIIFEIKPEGLLLIGSVAMQKQRETSDIDFLAVAENKKVPYFENCNIITLNEKELKEKYLKGDDFIISALLFGKVILDRDIFAKLLENPLPAFSQEIIQEKITYCERLEERVYTLLKTDKKKAKEELLYLALQTARIILLRNKIIPKTKYEIPRQVGRFDKTIESIINKLIKTKEMNAEKMLDYTKSCMHAVK